MHWCLWCPGFTKSAKTLPYTPMEFPSGDPSHAPVRDDNGATPFLPPRPWRMAQSAFLSPNPGEEAGAATEVWTLCVRTAQGSRRILCCVDFQVSHPSLNPFENFNHWANLECRVLLSDATRGS